SGATTPIGPRASPRKYHTRPDEPARPASAPTPAAAAEGRPGRSIKAGSSAAAPANCATAITASVPEVRRVARPPAKSATPKLTAAGSASGTVIPTPKLYQAERSGQFVGP